MRSDAAAFRHFHLRQSRAAPPAPRHDVVPAVDVTLVVALLEKPPDRVIIFVGESEIAAAILSRTQPADNLTGSRRFDAPAGQLYSYNSISVSQRVAQSEQNFGIVPVAPIPQPDGLLGLPRGESQHALLAGSNEFLNAVFPNLALGLESKAFFYLDLDPQSLAIESVLVALRLAVHGVVALIHVLQGAAPRVMHAHGIIRRDRPVEERPARAICILLAQLVENAILLPEAQHLALHGGEVRHFWNWFVHVHQ